MDGAATAMAGRGARRGFRRGLVATLPLLLGVAPFGLVFGVIARETGLDLVQTMVMTATVIAGAAQIASLQLLSEGAPALVAVFAGAVVNLRMAMYSASLAVWWTGVPMRVRALAACFLHDQSFALSVRAYRADPAMPTAERVAFYFAVGLLTASTWTASTYVGATAGGRLPEDLDLGFIVPVTFLAVVAPMLRDRVSAFSACVAGVLGLLLAGLPYGLGLLLATAGGIAAGLLAGRGGPGGGERA